MQGKQFNELLTGAHVQASNTMLLVTCPPRFERFSTTASLLLLASSVFLEVLSATASLPLLASSVLASVPS